MILKKYKCDLKSCTLCQSCSKEWLPALDANRKVFQLKRGELLFKEGDEVKGMFFINKGLVKVHKRWGRRKRNDQGQRILRFCLTRERSFMDTRGALEVIFTIPGFRAQHLPRTGSLLCVDKD
jgi:hypothetical protein